MKRNAFTLLELSVALTIISLIIGAVIGGTSLIETNLMRSIIKDFNNYQSALVLFKNQYGYYPGDSPNANKFFNISSSNVGNGNNIIETNGEDIYAWQHLSLSGIIDGNYSGAYSTPKYYPGVNLPAARISNAGFTFEWYYPYGSVYYKVLSLSSNFHNAASYLNGGAIKPLIASNIDKKIDDGIASTGQIIALRAASDASNSVCVDKAYSTSLPAGTVANYLSNTDNTISCRLWYLY